MQKFIFKFFVCIFLLFVFSVNTFAAVTGTTLGIKALPYSSIVATDLAVASTATVYSSKFFVPGSQYHGIYLKAAGAGTIAITVTLQVSFNNGTTWSTPNSAVSITSLSNSTAFLDNLDLIFIPWARLKFEGTGSNGADVTVDCVVFQDTKIQ